MSDGTLVMTYVVSCSLSCSVCARVHMCICILRVCSFLSDNLRYSALSLALCVYMCVCVYVWQDTCNATGCTADCNADVVLLTCACWHCNADARVLTLAQWCIYTHSLSCTRMRTRTHINAHTHTRAPSSQFARSGMRQHALSNTATYESAHTDTATHCTTLQHTATPAHWAASSRAAAVVRAV